MSCINLYELLTPLDEPPEPGRDDEYDHWYERVEIEQAARGTAERRFGDAVQPGLAPDWARVAALAHPLAAQSRSLRLAVPLARAATHLEGAAGLADGLELVLGLVEDFWDRLIPALDPGDAEPAWRRMQALAPLGDREGLLADILALPAAAADADAREHLAAAARWAHRLRSSLADRTSPTAAALLDPLVEATAALARGLAWQPAGAAGRLPDDAELSPLVGATPQQLADARRWLQNVDAWCEHADNAAAVAAALARRQRRRQPGLFASAPEAMSGANDSPPAAAGRP